MSNRDLLQQLDGALEAGGKALEFIRMSGMNSNQRLHEFTAWNHPAFSERS